MPAGKRNGERRRPASFLPRAAIAGGLCAAAYLGLLALYAYLSFRLELPAGADLPVGLGLAALCACAAGFLCAGRAQRRFLLCGALCGAIACVPVCAALWGLGGAGIGLPLLAGILLAASAAGGLAASRGAGRVRL